MRILTLLALLGTLFRAESAWSCDPNESCNRCLANNPFNGNCIQSGNDPVCEARKKACQIAPPTVNTPGSPFGPGGPLSQGGPVGMNPDQVRQCVADLHDCAPQILARLGYQAIRPIVDQYIGFLRNQAGSNYESIPPALIVKIQNFYPVNLQDVRFAFNINTIHGADITIGNEIYFTRSMDFSEKEDAAALYHELQHVVQYARRGGIEPFMTEYVLKSGGSIIRGGNTVDMHDNIDLERDANSKSNEVLNAVGADE